MTSHSTVNAIFHSPAGFVDPEHDHSTKVCNKSAYLAIHGGGPGGRFSYAGRLKRFGQTAGRIADEEESMEVTLTFEKEKETKNTIRFQEKPAEGQPPIVGTLYVAKFWAGNAERLTVTITKTT